MAFHKYLVPGLDVLIGNPSFLTPTAETRPKARRLLIPDTYLYRIDDFHNEQTSRGEAARELQGIFRGEILRKLHEDQLEYYTFENGMQLQIIDSELLHFSPKLNPRSSKAQAIATANFCFDGENRKFFDERTKINATNLAIMTGSDPLAILSYLHNIDVAMVNPEVYTGRRTVELPFEVSSLWFSNHKIDPLEWKQAFPDQSPLLPNEFVEFTGDYPETHNRSWKNIGRCDPTTGTLLPLRFRLPIDRGLAQKFWPRSAGQAMVMEALLAPVEEIPIVVISGIFGTGKTFLSLAAGHFLTNGGVADVYERIFVCPRDGALGAEIGFLPGDATNKTRAKAKPIEDNYIQILKLQNGNNREKLAEKGNVGLGSAYDQFERLVKDHKIEFESVINMGGRSLADSFIIYDEFQDMERYQAKALLSRPADGSKMVIMGDPTQTTNPHLNATSNGLSYSASKLAGKPEAAVITLFPHEITRSRAARAIATYFT